MTTPDGRIDGLIEGLMPRPDRYPRPSWEEIGTRVTEAAPPDEHAVWWSIALRWMDQHCLAAGKEYWCTQSENFLLASPLDKHRATNLIRFAERARRGIAKALNGVIATDGFGPHVILVFETEDEYYEYIAPFYIEGEHYAASAGVHLN